MNAFSKLAAALAAPFLLASCFFSPGEFTSSLDIRADRSFRFAYAGEVIFSKPNDTIPDPEESSLKEPAEETGMTEAQVQSIIEALRKEEGYRSVEYAGGDTFRVDYEISGRLDHAFVYPLNLDATAILPWIAVELRAGNQARVTGMAFGSDGGISGMPSAPDNSSDAGNRRNGTFTLTTDAEIVMHNNEDGMTPGAESRIVWTVTPGTRSAPTAVVAFTD